MKEEGRPVNYKKDPSLRLQLFCLITVLPCFAMVSWPCSLAVTLVSSGPGEEPPHVRSSGGSGTSQGADQEPHRQQHATGAWKRHPPTDRVTRDPRQASGPAPCCPCYCSVTWRRLDHRHWMWQTCFTLGMWLWRKKSSVENMRTFANVYTSNGPCVSHGLLD